MISFFDESEALKDKFGKQATRVLLKTLNPVFYHRGEINLKMDTKTLEYFKNCRAVFEVRHYFIEHEETLLRVGHVDNESQASSEFDVSERDYITLGYAKVPLMALLTNSSGFKGEVKILDDFSQNLGSLELELSLNF